MFAFYLQTMEALIEKLERQGIDREKIDNARKRGRAYQCLWCHIMEGKKVVDIKCRIEDHIIQKHMDLTDVPVYCNLCLYRCQKEKQWPSHITKIKQHMNLAKQLKITDHSLCMVKNDRPRAIGSTDFSVLSPEDSLLHFLGLTQGKDGSQLQSDPTSPTTPKQTPEGTPTEAAQLAAPISNPEQLISATATTQMGPATATNQMGPATVTDAQIAAATAITAQDPSGQLTQMLSSILANQQFLMESYKASLSTSLSIKLTQGSVIEQPLFPTSMLEGFESSVLPEVGALMDEGEPAPSDLSESNRQTESGSPISQDEPSTNDTETVKGAENAKGEESPKDKVEPMIDTADEKQKPADPSETAGVIVHQQPGIIDSSERPEEEEESVDRGTVDEAPLDMTCQHHQETPLDLTFKPHQEDTEDQMGVESAALDLSTAENNTVDESVQEEEKSVPDHADDCEETSNVAPIEEEKGVQKEKEAVLDTEMMGEKRDVGDHEPEEADINRSGVTDTRNVVVMEREDYAVAKSRVPTYVPTPIEKLKELRREKTVNEIAEEHEENLLDDILPPDEDTSIPPLGKRKMDNREEVDPSQKRRKMEEPEKLPVDVRELSDRTMVYMVDTFRKVMERNTAEIKLLKERVNENTIVMGKLVDVLSQHKKTVDSHEKGEQSREERKMDFEQRRENERRRDVERWREDERRRETWRKEMERREKEELRRRDEKGDNASKAKEDRRGREKEDSKSKDKESKKENKHKEKDNKTKEKENKAKEKEEWAKDSLTPRTPSEEKNNSKDFKGRRW